MTGFADTAWTRHWSEMRCEGGYILYAAVGPSPHHGNSIAEEIKTFENSIFFHLQNVSILILMWVRAAAGLIYKCIQYVNSCR